MAIMPKVGPHEHAISAHITVSNTLLIASPFDSFRLAAISDLCTPTTPSDLDVLYVSLSQSPMSVVKMWSEHVGTPPHSLTVITPNQYLTDRNSTASFDGTEATVSYIRSPGDLTSLGIQLTNAIDEWNDPTTTGILCVDSVTPIEQFAGLAETFDFFQSVATKTAVQNVRAIYLIDPTTVDARTLETFKELFDATVELKQSASDSDVIDIKQRLP